MTSSRSSSSRRALAALSALLALAACAHRPAPPPQAPRARLALLPPENATGGVVSLQVFSADLERALAAASIEVVQGDAVREYLARHRIRYTAGIDGESARAAREELGVDGLLATSVEQYDPSDPPRLAVAMRVVSAEDEPRIEWVGGAEVTGGDAPGFLGLGVIHSLPDLERVALRRVARALASFLDGRAARSYPSSPGLGLGWWHRAKGFDTARPLSVVVLPFVNRTSRRGAGEIVALALARELAAVPRLQVIEPGIIRDELLAFRVVMPEGPSLDDALVLNASLRADLIVFGQVFQFEEAGVGPPRVSFSAVALDGPRKRVVWRSSSYATGDDRVIAFDIGRIRTATGLACRMAHAVVDGLVSGKD